MSRAHTPAIARIVVEVEPFHLDHPFDYLVPDDVDLQIGQRVEVLFAGRLTRGLVVGLGDDSEIEPGRLRPIRRVLGPHPWVRDDELDVLRWAAQRFGAPLADVIRHALPSRTVDVERRAAAAGWFPPGAATRPGPDPAPVPADDEAWAPYGRAGERLRGSVAGGRGSFFWRPVAGEDVGARLGELVEATLAAGRDAVVVVPDRGSRAAQALVDRFGGLVADLRGDRSPRRIYSAWLRTRCGVARVVVGERGAAFAPVDRLGLAVVVDEANPMLKERRSPRHHAREVLLERARRAGGVGVAVGLVPSAAMWRLVDADRVHLVEPSRDVEARRRPTTRVVDWRLQPRARMSRDAVRALRRAVAASAYGVVLATRRGEGRAFVCGTCGEQVVCPRCQSSLARRADEFGCVGCGFRSSTAPPCPACGGHRLVPLAAGARRLADEVARSVDAPVAVLEGYDAPAPAAPAVLVMTRGAALDAPPGPIGAVVLPDLDALLRRPTLDAAEDALRLAMTLAGWTRATNVRDADVIVQTDDPSHHAIDALRRWDPWAFWDREVAVRAPLRFPPVAYALRLEVGVDATDELVAALPAGDELLGPVPSNGANGYLVKVDSRERTLAALAPLRARFSRDGIDLRVDVDPVDAD